MLLYGHRNRRLIRDGSPGRPPRLSQVVVVVVESFYMVQFSALEQTHCTLVACDFECMTIFL